MRNMCARLRAGLWVASLAVTSAQASAAEPLSSYNVDIKQTSVSGLSSGAYMAQQFHVAFSSDLIGAGIVAGGPYYCAQGLLSNALGQCMKTTLGAPDPRELFAVAQEMAREERIDNLGHLVDDSVYIFAGTEDGTVSPEVVAQIQPFYQLAGLDPERIRFVDDLAAGHALITEDFGAACGETGSPFINDCDYDQAGDILAHIYGALAARGAAVEAHLLAFDQSEFLGDPNRHGMNETGYLYLPASCAAGAACRVHVVFHGCKQTTADIGDLFVRQSRCNMPPFYFF